MSSDLRKLKELEEERKSKMSIYTMTIYAIYLLLLFIIIVLTESLVPAIPKMQSAGEFLGATTIGRITEYEFRTLLFHVSLVEAFFAGIIAGQMGTGRISSGLKHSVILVLITLLAFQFVQPPTPVEKIAETIMDVPPTPGLTTKGIMADTELTQSFTTTDVAKLVAKLAKERNREPYKGFKSDDVEFFKLNCRPCDEGKIDITEKEVKVREKTRIRFSVKYAEDHYVVSFQDVTNV